MSFLISQDDDPDNNRNHCFHSYPVKRILTSVGIFDSHYHYTTSASQLTVHRLLDINHNYKFEVSIKAQKDNLFLSSILFKNTQLLTIRDTSTKVIYYRLVQKYYSKSQLTLYLTTNGNFATKKTIVYDCLDTRLTYSLRKDHIKKQVNRERDNIEQLKSTLLQFIQQSASFYKILIPKLQCNITQISRLRPLYSIREFLAVNLCNCSCYPTFQMYRKQIQASSQILDLERRFIRQDPSQIQRISQVICQQKELYSPHISSSMLLPSSTVNRNSNFHSNNSNVSLSQQHYYSPLQIDTEINNSKLYLQQIYNKLIQRKQRYRQKFIQSQMIRTQSKIDILYKTLVTNLDVALAKKQTKQNKIYNHVHVVNPEQVKWENFEFTSLSQLKIGKIKYLHVQEEKLINKQKSSITNINNNNSKHNSFNHQLQNQQSYQATVILKHQPQKLLLNNPKPSQTSQQLKWQKTIIQQCFKNSYCIYMTRFFSPHEPSKLFTYPNLKTPTTYILSEYIRRGTLQKWLYQSSYTNSIFTKVNVLLYILYGMMFVHSKKVVHMDIKPQNILIDKNLVPKIADFGSAYNKQVYQKMRKQKIHYYLSFSIPYTAPQIFMRSHKPQINAKCDVFSLGLIIYEIFFNRCIFGQTNSDRLDKIYRNIGMKMDQWEERKIKNNMKEFNEVPQELLLKKIYLCPQTHQIQQSSVYHLLMNLVTRCLSCDQERRPNVGMLVIAIKQIFQMTVQYYAW